MQNLIVKCVGIPNLIINNNSCTCVGDARVSEYKKQTFTEFHAYEHDLMLMVLSTQ